MIFKREKLRNFFMECEEYAPVVSFRELDADRGIILRHDIDLDVKPAYEMAMLEQDCGITSSILFLTTCQTYNINSSLNRSKIRHLADAGFDVGLHFDPTVYESHLNLEELRRKVIKEASQIEDITGMEVTTISLHAPSVSNQLPLFDGFINTYDRKYFQPDNYMSDSRMNFRGKNPFEFIKRAEKYLLQVLLHPIYYTDAGYSYSEIMKNLVFRFADDADEMCSLVNEYHKPNLNFNPIKRALFEN